jgi:hypothetical protein
MEEQLDTDISRADFDSAVNELYLRQVAPAVEELQQSLRDEGALLALARAVKPTIGGAVGLAAAFAIGAPHLAGATALAAGVSKAVADEVLFRHREESQRRKNRFFLLYDAERQLAGDH